MIEKDRNLPANTVTAKEGRTLERARNYEEKFTLGSRRNMKLNKAEKAFARLVFEMVGSDSHIVDAPCGSGRFFEILSQAKELTMVDYSINMLKICEEKVGTADNVRLIQADISSIPLPDSSADLCFCMRLFHHMQSDQIRLAALKELARISKKYIALTFYSKNCFRFYQRHLRGKKRAGHYISASRMFMLANQAGLEIVKRWPKVNVIEQQCLAIFRKRQDV